VAELYAGASSQGAAGKVSWGSTFQPCFKFIQAPARGAAGEILYPEVEMIVNAGIGVYVNRMESPTAVSCGLVTRSSNHKIGMNLLPIIKGVTVDNVWEL